MQLFLTVSWLICSERVASLFIKQSPTNCYGGRFPQNWSVPQHLSNRSQRPNGKGMHVCTINAGPHVHADNQCTDFLVLWQLFNCAKVWIESCEVQNFWKLFFVIQMTNVSPVFGQCSWTLDKCVCDIATTHALCCSCMGWILMNTCWQCGHCTDTGPEFLCHVDQCCMVPNFGVSSCVRLTLKIPLYRAMIFSCGWTSDPSPFLDPSFMWSFFEFWCVRWMLDVLVNWSMKNLILHQNFESDHSCWECGPPSQHNLPHHCLWRIQSSSNEPAELWEKPLPLTRCTGRQREREKGRFVSMVEEARGTTVVSGVSPTITATKRAPEAPTPWGV